MISAASIFFGLKHLFKKEPGGKNKFRLKGAVIGIGLSLIPLIIVIVVTNGMIEGITRRYVEIGSYHLQIKSFVSPDAAVIDELTESLKDIPEIASIIPVIDGLGLAYSEEGRCGAALRALPTDIYDKDPALQEYLEIIDGEFDLTDENAILISSEIAERLDVSAGDRLKVLTTKRFTGRTPILRPNLFIVKGIFTTGYYELDSSAIFIPFEKGKQLFTEPGSFFIGVKVENGYDQLNKIKAEIVEAIPSNWYVYTWMEIDRSMYKGFQTTKLLLIFIMILIVIVASVNISSSMVMLIMEKTKDIAILKAVGGSPSDIAVSFLLAGFIVGLFGTIIGIIFGLLLAVNINEIISGIEILLNSGINFFGGIFSPHTSFSPISVDLFDSAYYLEKIPIKISIGELFLTAVLTIFLSTVAAYFPARTAGKIKPLEILRKH